MALIDEAFNPGVFQDKLKTQCEANGILPIKYTLEPNTAKDFVKTLSGAKDLDLTQNLQISKYSKDQLGGKKYLNQRFFFTVGTSVCFSKLFTVNSHCSLIFK